MSALNGMQASPVWYLQAYWARRQLQPSYPQRGSTIEYARLHKPDLEVPGQQQEGREQLQHGGEGMGGRVVYGVAAEHRSEQVLQALSIQPLIQHFERCLRNFFTGISASGSGGTFLDLRHMFCQNRCVAVISCCGA